MAVKWLPFSAAVGIAFVHLLVLEGHREHKLGWGRGLVYASPEAQRKWNETRSTLLDATAGAMSGAVASTITCPLDVLKTRLQVQRGRNAPGMGPIGVGKSVGKIFQKEGIKGLYAGWGPSLLALLPNWAAYFPVYTATKNYLSEKMPDRPTAVHSLAAVSGGAASLLASNPCWVAKTRLQTQALALSIARNANGVPYKGPFDCIRRIAKEEGLAGLYSGLSASIFGLLHVGIQFPIYEALKTRMNDTHANSNGYIGSLVGASALSKLIAASCTYPHEVARSYMQVAGVGGLAGLRKACRHVYREDGLRGFYRGYVTSLCRTIPGSAVTLPSYEVFRRGLERLVEGRDQKVPSENGDRVKSSKDKDKPPSY
ncbi:hypothetical protein AAMO2058_000758500 [Amorphochlora amoebiformis]